MRRDVELYIIEIHFSWKIYFIGWLDGWMVGESGIKANSAQLSWSLAELGNTEFPTDFLIRLLEIILKYNIFEFNGELSNS